MGRVRRGWRRGLCASCAVGQAERYGNSGRAIDMVNGEEAYDDDFVQEWCSGAVAAQQLSRRLSA